MSVLVGIIIAIVVFLGFTAFFGAPYVPSLPSELRKAFSKLYKLGSSDLLIDLGAGDGVVQKIASGEFGAKSVGVELNPLLVLIARFRLRKINRGKQGGKFTEKISDPQKPTQLARVICKNFFNYDFPPETTVIYIFGESRDIEKMFNKVQTEANRLEKDLYIISNGFQSEKYKYVKNVSSFYLYKIKH